jgi:class 3 adenylate cyclase/tetratricopeptide (TPR) repeat protein
MTEPTTVRKTVTVVFTDVAGSTALGERRDPEIVRRVMTRYFAAMRDVVERHGGTVEKFIGDAIMAVFGIPVLHEDDALRAVRAASEMRSVLATLNEQLQADWGITIATRTGINTGEVVASQAMPGEPLVTGDAVNVAARLEQAASPGEILIGAATHRLVRGAVVVEVVEPMDLKGKAEPSAAVRLVQVLEGVEPLTRRLDSPMVGRDRQLDVMSRAFEAAIADRACHLFTVLGTAGVGKSRLLGEFIKGVIGRATILQGRCLSYGQGITLWPVAEVVRTAAGLQDFDEPATAERRIADLLLGDEHAGAITGRLMQIIGASGGGSAPPEEAQWAVRRLLEILGGETPLVVVFDDLHWAEPTLLDLIDQVADATRDASILLVCTARPEFLDTRANWAGGKLNATTVLLEPLTDIDSETLIANLLGTTALAPDIRSRILQAAGGNPLFVEQMLAMLIDDGLIREAGGRWVPTADHLEVSVPPTIAALLSARLERLGTDERDAIGRAAVIGKVFYPGAIHYLWPEASPPQINALLRSLVRKDLIRPDRSTLPGEDAYRFRHILVQESAYEALAKDVRATLHERFADWLEQTAGDRIEEQEEILGYHLERAYRYRELLGVVTDAHRAVATKAAARLSSAGLRAMGRFDHPAAINLLSRASSVLPANSPARLELLPDLAVALTLAEQAGDAERLWAEAAEGARAIGDDRLLAHALVQRWRWSNAIDVERDKDAAARDAEWAAGTFEASGDARGMGRAWLLRGQIAIWNGRFGEDEGAVERALVFAKEAGDVFDEFDAFFSLSADVVRGATPVGIGIQRCKQVLAEHENQRSVEAAMWHALAHLTARTGAFDEARAFAVRMREFFRDTGQQHDLDFWSEVPGDVEMVAGDPAAAESIMREGYEALESRGSREPLLGAFLARSICAQQRWADAEPYAELAASSGTSRIGPALGKGALARIRAHQGRVTEAEGLAREAVALLAQTDCLVDQADILTDLADVLVVAGRPDEARAALSEALALYQRKGDVVTPIRIHAAIDSIASGT